MNARQQKIMRRHASGVIRLSPFLVLAAAAFYLISFPHVPFSLAYQLTAVLAGAVSFPLLWHHWRKQSMALFITIIMLLTFGSQIARDHILGVGFPLSSLWPDAQFLSLFFFVLLSLVFLFRSRMRSSLPDAAPSA